MNFRRISVEGNRLSTKTASLRRASGQTDLSLLAESLENDLNGLSADQMAKMHMRTLRHMIIPVNSTFRQIWDILLAINTIYISIIIPIRIGFSLPPSLLFIIYYEHFIDLTFLIDIFLNFGTSFIDASNKDEVKNHEEIFERYLFGWFLIDLISSLPVSFITNYSGNHLRIDKILSCLKLLKIIKPWDAPIFEKLSDFCIRKTNPFFIRIIKLIGFFTICEHFMACSYRFTCGYENYKTDWTPGISNKLYPIMNQYTYDLHWAVLVTEAQDMEPHTGDENIFSSIMFFLGIFIDATIIGIITSLLSNVDKNIETRRSHNEVINKFFSIHNIPNHIRLEIQKFYEYKWGVGYRDNEKHLFGQLPNKLQMELNIHLKKKFINQTIFLRLLSPNGLATLLHQLKSQIILPDELIISDNELGDDFYFISRGSVMVDILIKNKIKKDLTILIEGQFFGEIALLSEYIVTLPDYNYYKNIFLPNKRSANIRAMNNTFCEIEILNGDHFKNLIQISELFRNTLLRYSEKRLKKKQDMIQNVLETLNQAANHSNGANTTDMLGKNLLKYGDRKPLLGVTAIGFGTSLRMAMLANQQKKKRKPNSGNTSGHASLSSTKEKNNLISNKSDKENDLLLFDNKINDTVSLLNNNEINQIKNDINTMNHNNNNNSKKENINNSINDIDEKRETVNNELNMMSNPPNKQNSYTSSVAPLIRNNSILTSGVIMAKRKSIAEGKLSVYDSLMNQELINKISISGFKQIMKRK